MILYRRKKYRKCHPDVSVLLSSLMLKNRFAELLQRQSVLHLCAVSAEEIANSIVKAMSLPNDPQVKFSRKLACLFSLAAFLILQLLPEIQWYHCLNREQSALKYLVRITPLHDTLKRLAPLIHPIRIATRLHTFPALNTSYMSGMCLLRVLIGSLDCLCPLLLARLWFWFYSPRLKTAL